MLQGSFVLTIFIIYVVLLITLIRAILSTSISMVYTALRNRDAIFSTTSSPHVNNETLLSIAGGLFHPADDKQEIAFRYAVEKINSDRSILPRSKLSAQIEKIPPQDSFHASKKGELWKKMGVLLFCRTTRANFIQMESSRC